MLTTVIKRRKKNNILKMKNIEVGLSKNPRKTHTKHPIPFAIKDVKLLKFNSHFV